jgi:M6 family metalloprotease-like protein
MMLPNIGPYESIYPMRNTTRKVMVILWDPHYPGVVRPSRDEVEQAVFGPGRSVQNYFLENSGGTFTISSAGVYGWYEADHPLEWYDQPPYHDKMGAALRAANADVNFAQYETNHSGTLEPYDELCIVCAHPGGGATPGGLVRSGDREIHDLDGGPLVLDGVRIREGVEIGTGLPASPSAFIHELCHILLGLGDMYFTFFTSTGAGPYSVMDQHWTCPHIDPFQKLKLGWLHMLSVTRSGEYTVPDVETHHQVLLLLDDAGRGTDEYFIVENRWRGSSFDSVLPDQGIGVWHIMEDPRDYSHAPVPPFTDPEKWAQVKTQWPRSAIRMIRPVIRPPYDPARALWDESDPQTGYTLLSDDPDPSHPSLKWSDGTPSGFVLRFTAPSPTARVFVEVKILRLHPHSLSFPPIQIGSSLVETVEVHNGGDEPLAVTVAGPPAGSQFQWAPFSGTLAVAPPDPRHFSPHQIWADRGQSHRDEQCARDIPCLTDGEWI